ncbi:hypothetical protein C2845_PM10G10250 [Panicum miliaceum]|uniref:Transposase (putative) gypsy type domain-containing protein n=1 Tax=Panicum miliaceum TaxID=4540 RepID=A0A3L6PAU7_PANMI|nr:hypothetical protein C2845_PM10G10250 [Panicum miliaceum]
MARVEETVKLIVGCESGVEVEDLVQQSGDREDLSQVEADISELMGRDSRNQPFGSGYFKAGECRAPMGEDTPVLLEDETVVFWVFFTVGLRSSLDPIFPEILARFNVKMYHLTPNAIIQLSRFF